MSSQPPKKESKSEEKTKKEEKAKKEGKEAKKEGKEAKKEVVGTSKALVKRETEEKKKAEGAQPPTKREDSDDETWQDEIYHHKSIKKDSLRIPKEKVNDPALPPDDADDEREEAENEGRKSIKESRSRRPTTPIPEEKKSISQEETTQVMVAQESAPERGSTTWTVAGGRTTLAVPSPFPAGQSPDHASIATSRTRRPTTPIPIASPRSSHTDPPAPASDEGGGGSGQQATPSTQNVCANATPTIINRVDVGSTRFPGSFFENILPYPQNIQITVTSPEGHTTTPTVHLQTMTYEGGEPYSPIRRALSRSMQRSEPNIRH